MDVAKAFTFVTEDEQWVRKIGIGAVISFLSFLIIPAPLLVGYMVGITRNVRDGVERPLPEWDDYGQLFKDGLAVIVAQLVYTLPFWIIVCIAVVATVGMGGIAETTAASEDLLAAGFLATWGLVSCLSLLFFIALFFLSPAIVIQYVQTGELGALFRLGEVISIARDNIGDILVAALASFGVSIVLSLALGLLNIIPCLGQIASGLISIAAMPYLTAVTGHLYGQIASKGNEKLAKFV